ncbi:hypothetical protein PybrP1_010371 [[Pythium] brassicae (nom. inval.)]|nr:hypothetical protein PybrP1_010371 [[Pythium] brassicae (nom. inval.)]
MGRNRKGRQCGGYESKMERFALQRKWQREVARAVSRSHQRHVQLSSSAASAGAAADASRARRAVRVDVVKALMDARLKDDRVERSKQQSASAIASQLQLETAHAQQPGSLQDRCLYEIARTFDCYAAASPVLAAFFGTFEAWMLSRLSELATAFQTMGDANVALLLQQPTDALTLGFVRDERVLAPLVSQGEGDRQRMAWQLGGDAFQQQVESWDELDVDGVDIAPTHDVVHLRRLELVSCAGLSLAFAERLALAHPFLEHLKVVDCFDALDARAGAALLERVACWRSLETLHLSWCCWLSTEMLVAFANLLLEPRSCGASLRALHVADCFDVSVDYVRTVFAELHPHIRLTS